MKCKHEWKWLYKYDDSEDKFFDQAHIKNYDTFYCIHCLKQTSKERECPKEMKN